MLLVRTHVMLSDIDECQIGKHTCNKKAICTNTVGSYVCQCLPGYTGNGTHCRGLLNTHYFVASLHHHHKGSTILRVPVRVPPICVYLVSSSSCLFRHKLYSTVQSSTPTQKTVHFCFCQNFVKCP